MERQTKDSKILVSLNFTLFSVKFTKVKKEKDQKQTENYLFFIALRTCTQIRKVSIIGAIVRIVSASSNQLSVIKHIYYTKIRQTYKIPPHRIGSTVGTNLKNLSKIIPTNLFYCTSILRQTRIIHLQKLVSKISVSRKSLKSTN